MSLPLPDLLATAAATGAPAGGAPIRDILIVGVGSNLLFALTIALVLAYRRGGAPRLRRLAAFAEQAVGIPGWAAIPGIGAIAGALVTIWGATWDIGLHIDIGRDPGPLGTSAHYPLLFGLLTMFLMGVLSVGMAPVDLSRSSSAAFRLRGVGSVPAAAALLAAASAFAMIGFPLDDLWHRVFGQDVTLWGPTHTMFIGGVLTAGCGAVLLLAEGARAVGREPFGARGILRRPLAAVLAGIFLYLWTASLHEFNWGVPQYRELWQPMLLALGGAQTMVLARQLGGRGGCLGALAIWMPMQVAMVLVIGGPLHTTAPAMPLFVAEAAIVEALALRGDWRHPTRFGVVSGLAVGSLGFAANYAWSQVGMPLPWTPGLIPEALPVAIVAAVAGGLLGSLMAQALKGTLPAGRRPAVLAWGAALVVIALGVNAAIISSPRGVTAAMSLANVRQGVGPGGHRTTLADLTVHVSRADLTHDATWVYAMAWQGDGRYLNLLHRIGDGTFRSTQPVPIGGKWKSFVRVSKGRTMLSAAVRMPADPVLGFAGIPATRHVTREMVRDTKLLQIERKTSGPLWAWTPALLLVLALDFTLLVLMGFICVRLGRMVGRPRTIDPPAGVLLGAADRALVAVERRVLDVKPPRREDRVREPVGV